jgi:quercetin dioxygenase-like cupin family protein
VADLKITEAKSIPEERVTTAGAERVTIRWLISREDGAENFHLRLFTVARGGKTPLHTHAWEHEAYILAGEGTLIYDGEEYTFSKGDVIFVPAAKEHSFINAGAENLEFLCIVPGGRRGS